jgi:hypothetical protein
MAILQGTLVARYRGDVVDRAVGVRLSSIMKR